MLVLSRKLNEEIRIGENVVVRVIGIKGSQVRLGIVAPAEVPVMRDEILNTVPSPPRQLCLETRVLKHARREQANRRGAASLTLVMQPDG